MSIVIEEDIMLSKRNIRSALNNVSKSATIVKLIHVNDSKPGFKRVRTEKSFYYTDGDKKLEDELQLQRIKKLVIPPAWDKVWICKLPNGHLQATGFDAKKRKQYLYHPLWGIVRSHTKFYHLIEFGKKLPSIRSQLEKNLSLQGYPQEKVLAAVVSLLEHTNIRIGNICYEKLYGSFGLTTMKNRHVSINGTNIRFTFTGKKGVKHNIAFRSKRLASIIKGCKDIPGKELFEYYDEQNNIHPVDSGTVNEYIKNISGGDFTAKDFRTWAGSVHALLAFKELGEFENTADMKHKVSAMFEMVAKELGNTKAVCKKYYVHPVIVELYESKKLNKYLNELNSIQSDENKQESAAEEKAFMKILENN